MSQSIQEHMLQNIGISIDNPVIDGRWHSGRGKLGKVSYVGHYLPKGLLVRYRDHREPDNFHVFKEWEGQGIRFDAEEYRRRKAEAEAKAAEAARQEARERAELLAILQTIVTESVPASNEHPYIERKLILPIGARQAVKRYQITPATTEGRAQYIEPTDLLIPVYDHAGALQGIQQITSTGRKFARGTFKGGLLWIGGGLTTGEAANRLYIAEGYATAVSIHIRTRNPVIVAFSTSNLLPAGKWARDRYPGSELVFAVDNDIGSFIRVGGRDIENPGRHYAEQAAKDVQAAVITPPMVGKADWNDWHISQICK